jgi:hypothetical protein
MVYTREYDRREAARIAERELQELAQGRAQQLLDQTAADSGPRTVETLVTTPGCNYRVLTVLMAPTGVGSARKVHAVVNVRPERGPKGPLELLSFMFGRCRPAVRFRDLAVPREDKPVS